MVKVCQLGVFFPQLSESSLGSLDRFHQLEQGLHTRVLRFDVDCKSSHERLDVLSNLGRRFPRNRL